MSEGEFKDLLSRISWPGGKDRLLFEENIGIAKIVVCSGSYENTVSSFSSFFFLQGEDYIWEALIHFPVLLETQQRIK